MSKLNLNIIIETPSMIVLDKSGLKITFKMERPPDITDLLIINMTAHNSTNSALSEFLFQAAVPRVKIKLCIFLFIYITFVRNKINNEKNIVQFLDIPTTNAATIKYSYSSIRRSNSSNKSYKY